jgi:hypothetical protein
MQSRCAPESRSVADEFAGLAVEDLVVSSASTIAGLAYAKLEANDLPEARKAIDALQSLLPHAGAEHARDLQSALANLQVAFAAAAAG